MSDHHAGRKLLEDEEIALFEKRVGLYSRKLEKMNQPLSDEVRKILEFELHVCSEAICGASKKFILTTSIVFLICNSNFRFRKI